MNVNELAMQLVEKKKCVGYTVSTALSQYRDKYFPVVFFFETNGLTEWNDDTAELYREMIKDRSAKNELADNRYRQLLSGVDEMEHFHNTQELLWPFPKKKAGFRLNDYYQNIKDEFLKSEDFHPNTKGDINWTCDKYFSWLQHEGIKTLEKTNADTIQKYIRACSQEMSLSGLYNIRLYTKKLYQFLEERQYVKNSFDLIFSFRVSRETPQQPAADSAEIEMTLKSIDRNTTQGKRDYAMILLGTVMGLRACDIIRLKLQDIDWINGEISICQSKTGKTLTLPLIKQVGEALKEYILNGRPACDYDEIFIRMHAPHQPYSDGTGIQYLYTKYRRKAGLQRVAFDGKGFHSLRRAVGKNMITSGVPVTTVAQVLGHNGTSSINKYIALDSVHLKECALDFSGIEVTSI